MPASVNKIKKTKKKEKEPVSNPYWAWIHRPAYRRRRCQEQATRTAAPPSPPRLDPPSWTLDPPFQKPLWRCRLAMWRQRSSPSCLLASRERHRGTPTAGSTLPAPLASPSIRSALLEPRLRCHSPRSPPRWRRTRSPPWLLAPREREAVVVAPCHGGVGGREGAPSEEEGSVEEGEGVGEVAIEWRSRKGVCGQMRERVRAWGFFLSEHIYCDAVSGEDELRWIWSGLGHINRGGTYKRSTSKNEDIFGGKPRLIDFRRWLFCNCLCKVIFQGGRL